MLFIRASTQISTSRLNYSFPIVDDHISSSAKRKSCCLQQLITFDILINSFYKYGGACMTQGSAHNEKCDTKKSHVPKVKTNLKETAHLRFPEKVVHRVQKNVASS